MFRLWSLEVSAISPEKVCPPHGPGVLILKDFSPFFLPIRSSFCFSRCPVIIAQHLGMTGDNDGEAAERRHDAPFCV